MLDQFRESTQFSVARFDRYMRNVEHNQDALEARMDTVQNDVAKINVKIEPMPDELATLKCVLADLDRR